jgi:hypothetical protein
MNPFSLVIPAQAGIQEYTADMGSGLLASLALRAT